MTKELSIEERLDKMQEEIDYLKSENEYWSKEIQGTAYLIAQPVHLHFARILFWNLMGIQSF